VELIARAISDAISEARREAPTRPTEEEGEGAPYSSDAAWSRRQVLVAPQRGRAEAPSSSASPAGKPEAIAARLKGGAEGEKRLRERTWMATREQTRSLSTATVTGLHDRLKS
jgi:hypothetical protein